MSLAPTSVKMKYLFFFSIFIVVVISCNPTPAPKDYGVISNEIGEAPSIDTSNNVVRPVTLTTRLYRLTNKSTNHNIGFVCKAYLKGNGDMLLEKTEKHIVAPQETINLDIDSNDNHKLLKYEIVNASIIKD